jgi:hypothetical protein
MERSPSAVLAVRAAVGVALLAGAGFWLGRSPPPSDGGRAEPPPSSPPVGSALCPAGMLPDDGLCLPLPASAQKAPALARVEEASSIELLPDRPSDYAEYQLPVTPERIEPNGEGARLRVAAGAPVHALALEGQVGPAERRSEAAASGRLVTLHTVRRAESERRYLVVLEPLRLELAEREHALAAGLRVGRAVLGPAGSTLTLSVRQLRRATDAANLSVAQLLDDAHSIPCDARNVLQRKAP